MNILYIHQYFATPSEPGGTRSYWIAKELVERGHNVTMLCSTNRRHPNPVKMEIDGIDVIYVKNKYSNYMPAYKKIYSFLHFVQVALSAAKKLKDIDLVFATSTPLTVGYMAMHLKKTRGWKYVFEVRDLWPEFPIQIGAIKNKFAIKFLKKLESDIYRKSEFVIALSPGMQDGVVAAGQPIEKTAMIPNMSKPDKFFPHPKSVETAKEYGIDLSKFNVIHFGSMGRANGLSYITDAAEVLKKSGNDSINFIFMGSGATKPYLMKKVEEKGLDNVLFLDSQPMDILAEVVNCCDASITTFKNLPILKTNSPNKLFDSLSAGKPIIVNSAGWTKDLVEKENCGFFADPEKPEELAEKLTLYSKDQNLLVKWGENARQLSIEVFDKDILSKKVAAVLEDVYKSIS